MNKERYSLLLYELLVVAIFVESSDVIEERNLWSWEGPLTPVHNVAANLPVLICSYITQLL